MANPFTGGAAGFSGIDYLAPEVAQQQREIQRQQAIADLLRQQSLENNNQTQVVGGWAIPNSSAGRFSQLGQALMAGYMQRKIDGKQAAVAQQLAERLGGVSYAPASQSGSATAPMQPGTATSAPIVDGSVTAPSYDSRKVAAPGATAGGVGPSFSSIMLYNALGLPPPPKVLERLMGVEPNKEIVKVDAGNEVNVYAVDPVSGAQTLVTSLPKGVSPDADLSAGVTVRGQNMSAETARRGQDIGSADQQRGQNMTANTAALAAGGNGGFAGTSMQAQASNSYMRLTLKQQGGETLSPEENMELQLAIRVLNEPKVVGTVEGGFSLINPPPLPVAPTPPPAAAPQNSAPPASPAARPDLQPNFPDVRTPSSQPSVTQLSPGTKPPNETQAKAAGFASLMEAAESVVSATPGGAPTYVTKIASSVPKVGDSLQRAAQTPEQQKYEQAKENWARAKLRNESGAVIGEEELAAEIRTYFPQPGDGPEVVQQKANARALAVEAVKKQAGPTYPKTENAGGGQKNRKWSEL